MTASDSVERIHERFWQGSHLPSCNARNSAPGDWPKNALWVTSLWFGLGHYYGGFPSGPAGLIQTGLLALLMRKAMLDTRGLGRPWIIHMTIETVIYTLIAMTIG